MMLALLSTLAILTAASFALVVMGVTVTSSWNLIVAALLGGSVTTSPRPARRATVRRPISVQLRAPTRPLAAAA